MNEETLKKKVQVVVIADGCVLLFEFNNKLPNNYVGFQNITGEVEANESFPDAAVRELFEEAGITAQVEEVGLEFSFYDRWKRHCLEKVFMCHLDKKPTITLSDEHLFSKWVPLEKVVLSDYRFPTNFESFTAAVKLIKDKN
jgi:8-oxo-dGTP pyrophosphatase MutT (NUDIX family)